MTHFHKNRLVKAVMLALMIFTNLPYIYSAHDLVLLKGKTLLLCQQHWAGEGSGKMEKFPGRILLLSRTALALTTRAAALPQIHVTVG